MVHAEIDDGQFPERFVLDRLSDAEREQFEQHLVDCRECQEAVKTAAALSTGLQSVRSEFPAPKRPIPFWSQRITLAQGMGLAAVWFIMALTPSLFWYRQSVKSRAAAEQAVASLRADRPTAPAAAPRALPVYPLELSRGSSADEAAIEIAVVPSADSVILVLPRDAVRQASSAQLADASGRTIWELAALPDTGSDSVGLTAPASLLKPGSYVLSLRAAGKTVARFPLRVK
jgi:hypothetical protein